MKKYRLISAVLLTLMLLTLIPSCTSSSVVMTVGDIKISKDEYIANAMSIKSQFITENDIEETDDLWDQYVDSSYTSTVQQYLDSMIQTYIITFKLYSIHFDELGLELDEKTQNEIDETMNGYLKQYGSREAFEEALKSVGFTYKTFEDQFYSEAKKDAVIMHYFGENSTENPVTKDDLLAYYSEYYTKVKHVFLSTKDKEDNDLSKAEKAKIGKKAQEIYDKAVSGTDFDSLIKEYGEDPGMVTNPDGYVFSTEDTSYTRMFHEAAFKMKAGEIKLLQTNLGFHIMKRYPFTEQDIYEGDNKVSLIENMMSEESAKILEDLKERIGVEYNNALLEELSVVNLDPVTDTSGSDAQLDALKEQLGLTEETEE